MNHLASAEARTPVLLSKSNISPAGGLDCLAKLTLTLSKEHKKHRLLEKQLVRINAELLAWKQASAQQVLAHPCQRAIDTLRRFLWQVTGFYLHHVMAILMQFFELPTSDVDSNAYQSFMSIITLPDDMEESDDPDVGASSSRPKVGEFNVRPNHFSSPSAWAQHWKPIQVSTGKSLIPINYNSIAFVCRIVLNKIYTDDYDGWSDHVDTRQFVQLADPQWVVDSNHVCEIRLAQMAIKAMYQHHLVNKDIKVHTAHTHMQDLCVLFSKWVSAQLFVTTPPPSLPSSGPSAASQTVSKRKYGSLDKVDTSRWSSNSKYMLDLIQDKCSCNVGKFTSLTSMFGNKGRMSELDALPLLRDGDCPKNTLLFYRDSDTHFGILS